MKVQKLVAVALMGAVGVGGYLGLTATMSYASRKALARLEAEMPAGYHLAYSAAKTGIWVPKLVLQEVRVSVGEKPAFSAGRLSIRGWPGLDGRLASVSSLDLEQVRWDDGFMAMASRLHLDRPGFDTIGRVLVGQSPLDPTQLSFAGGRIENVRISGGSLPGIAEVGTVRLGATANDVVQSVALDNILLSTTRNDLPISRLSIEGVAVTNVSPKRLLASLGGGLNALFTQPIRALEIKNLEAEKLGEPGKLRMASLMLDQIEQKDDLPVAGRLRIQGLQPPAAPGAPSFPMDITAAGRVNPEDKTLTLSDFHMVSPGMGEMKLAMVLNNIPWPPAMALLVPSWIGTAIVQMELSYQDLGYTQQQVANAARQKGVSVETFVDQIRKEWDVTGLTSGPKMNQVATAITTFLAKPGRLAVVAKPEKPVLLLEVAMGMQQNPERTAEALNLFVTAQ